MNMCTRLNHKNFFFSLLIANTAMGMDLPYPQLQLEHPKKECPIIRGTICIGKQPPHNGGMFNFVHEPVYYPTIWEREYLQKAGINVSLYDPCIPVEIKFINTPDCFKTIENHKEGRFLRRPVVPVKNLVNLSTKSILRFTLYGHPVELICEKNPLINDKEFHKQFEKRMKKFYEKPRSWANMGQSVEEELIPAGIIIKTKYAPNTVQEHCTYTHGPNGCPSDLHLAKQILKPHNNSMFRHIMGRQTNQNPLKTQPQINTKLLLIAQRGSEYGRHEHCVLL